MFTFRKALVAATLVAASFAASPASAESYVPGDEVNIDLDVAHCHVGGSLVPIHAVATSGGQAVDGTMTIDAFGQTFEEDDNDLSVKADSPVVTKKTHFDITATFIPDDLADSAPALGAAQVTPALYSPGSAAALPTAFKSATVTVTIIIVPKSSGCDDGDDDGDGTSGLPNTGGTNAWYLIIGALMLAAGAATLEGVRRRKNNSF
ncbi:MAG: LPXTG cell wall anchor domain-containing protein [Aeromicrobium sp.]